MSRIYLNCTTTTNDTCQGLPTVTQVLEIVVQVSESVTLTCGVSLTNEVQACSCHSNTIIDDLEGIRGDYSLIDNCDGLT